uniref:Tensin 3 n=1 Tax=Anabas testudineus TaxID=64144 RepID=A0A3Q1H4P9_ANATE
MEEPRRIDLTYITERIITIFCPHECTEETYLQSLQELVVMLQSKHGHNYMLINVSQKNDTLTRMNHKVLDTGWMDFLAPCLDQILSVCTEMENWLQTNQKHVVVLHCRGGKGRLGVLVASYIHFTNMSSADLSLDHFAMRRFYNDKLSALMTPSQKRYVWMLGSMLKGGLRMCSSPTFLLCVVLHGPPKIRPDGGEQHMSGMVCYDKNSRSSSRQVVFRLQFHTGLVHGHTLTFSKADLDCASEDPRFPEDGKVELFLSESPEKITGRLDHSDFISAAPPHVLDPGNGSLYARVRERSSEEGFCFPLTSSSPSYSDRAPSASSDSGLSVASQRLTEARQKRGAARDKGTHPGRQLPGLDFEIAQPLLEVMSELAALGGGEEMVGEESGLGHTINGEAESSERETDILDDEDEVDDVAAPVSDMLNSSSIGSLSLENLPETQRSDQTEYSTHSWVRQQQMVDLTHNNFTAVGGKERPKRMGKDRPPPLVAPDTPPRGFSSREAVQRGLMDENGTHSFTQNTNHTSPCQEDELASLTTDIDESIEQLNQLILDLDPTFVPVPTRCAPLSRSASLHTNGLSHKGNTHLSGKTNRRGHSTPPPMWHDRTPNSMNSPYPPQPSPPLSLNSPNAHSSPRGAMKGLEGDVGVRREADSTDLTLLLLGNGGLDHSLLEAMEGLGGLNLRGDGGLAPQLPEKRRGGELDSRSPSLSGFSSPHSGSSLSIPFSSPMTPDPLRGLSGAPSPGADFGSKHDTVKFVQDTSKFWYKPDISRDQAIAVLKDKEPGSFIVRDSHSFRGAYGLAMKVATPPPTVLQQSKKVGDMSNELVRHFLIECTQKGVRLKGCPNEPYFGSLTALVCQHSITPLALPCKLILPDRDPVEELNDSPAQTATNSAAELLKQGAACNVWYLGSVELESLTGHQAVQKATTLTLSMDPPPASTVVHFKVSAQGITLTDNQRKLFFRRHYAVNTVIFCSLDPQGRKIFGFVARKAQSETENMCHLFAEHDPEQPASAIVNFVSKVMIGSNKK